MENPGSKIPDLKIITVSLILLLALMVYACQKVEKPSREATGPMSIIIDIDIAPDSHTANTTWDGEELIPYQEIPVIGKIFRTRLKGIDYWRVYHPYLVTGTTDPALLADPDERCLDCHDQNTSCNNCHQYVGAKLIKEGGE